MGDHLLGRDADGLWNVVGDVEIRWPDCADALSHGSRSGVGLNSVPEECSDHTDDDGEAGEVPTEGGAHCDGEGNVEASTDHTVEDEGNGAADGSEDDTVDGLAPRDVNKRPLGRYLNIPSQSYSQDRSRSFPTLSIHSIREPETQHGERRPRPTFNGSDIHIDVGPCQVRSEILSSQKGKYQVPSSAKLDACLGSTHPESLRFALAPSLIFWTRWRTALDMVKMLPEIDAQLRSSCEYPSQLSI